MLRQRSNLRQLWPFAAHHEKQNEAKCSKMLALPPLLPFSSPWHTDCTSSAIGCKPKEKNGSRIRRDSNSAAFSTDFCSGVGKRQIELHAGKHSFPRCFPNSYRLRGRFYS